MAYPPELVLREASLVSKTPGAVSTTASMWASSGRKIRAYQLFNFSVDPADPAKGSQWVAYDCGKQRTTVLIEDMNAVCGVKAKAGVSGQRITATMQSGLLLGTGPVKGATAFQGGAVVRLPNIMGCGEETEVLVGRLPVGWGAVRFNQQGARVLLAGNIDRSRYRLYLVGKDKLRDFKVEGGDELRSFFVADGMVYYCNLDGTVMAKPLTADKPAEKVAVKEGELLDILVRPDMVELYRGTINDAGSNTLEPENQYRFQPDSGMLAWVTWNRGRKKPKLSGTKPDQLKGVDRCAADLNPRQWGWQSAVRPQKHWNIDDFGWQLMDRSGIRKGVIVFARRPEGADADHLYLWCHGNDKTYDLGTAADFKGQRLPRIDQVRVTAGGSVGVLAGNGKLSVFQLYHYPLQKQASADRAELIAYRAPKKLKPVSFRMVQNLYALDEVADRGYDSMLAASDGKIYFGTMPHSPVVGSGIYRYDPATDKVTMLGRFDDFAGTGKESVKNMMHARPAEVKGRLYWTGQDPFYGKRNFPGWTKEKNPYEGSPLVMQDLKTGKFKSLGIPFPEDKQGIFVTIGDEKRNCLYVRLGYGGGAWYELGLNDDGTLSGMKRKLPLKSGAVQFGADGALYEIRYAKWEKRAPHGAQIWRYDPKEDSPVKVAAFTAEALHGKPFKLARKDKAVRDDAGWLRSSADGKSLCLYLKYPAMVVRYHIPSRSVKRVGSFMKEGAKFPADIHNPRVMGRDQVWLLHRGTALRVSSMDLVSGAVKRFGHLIDDKGRYVEQVTQFVSTPNGTLYFGGVVHGHPDDTHWWLREEYKTPWKRVSGFFEIKALPTAE